MSAFNGKAPYAPDYASYNWIGAPANYALSTNKALGGDSRMFLSDSRSPTTTVSHQAMFEQAPKTSTNGSNQVTRPTSLWPPPWSWS